MRQGASRGPLGAKLQSRPAAKGGSFQSAFESSALRKDGFSAVGYTDGEKVLAGDSKQTAKALLGQPSSIINLPCGMPSSRKG